MLRCNLEVVALGMSRGENPNAKAVLSNKTTRNRKFLPFGNSLRNLLGRRSHIIEDPYDKASCVSSFAINSGKICPLSDTYE